MRTCYIAMSFDGFIARKDGSIDWLPQPKDFPDEDFGYKEFYSSVDVIVMGRKTYEQILTFGKWPYPDKKCYVCTSQETGSTDNVTFVDDPDVSGKHVWVLGGGELVKTMMQKKLITDFIITIIPKLIGSGISLFGDIGEDVLLTLKNVKDLGHGMVQVHYKI